MNKPYPIYPSQTKAFKQQTSSYASTLARETNTKMISAFRRNDLMAMALGYKGHSDLLNSAEFRKQADTEEPLFLFKDQSVLTSIIQVFSANLPSIDGKVIKAVSLKMHEHEVSIAHEGGWTVESVFEHPAIDTYEAADSGYSFYLKGMSTKITVTLTDRAYNNGVNFMLSHYIHTPTQIAPYIPSRQHGDYLGYALHRAVTAITAYYQEAINKGHEPRDSWLVKRSTT